MKNMPSWELTIPSIPPTLNHMTKRLGNRYFLSPEYLRFKAYVESRLVHNMPTWPEGVPLVSTIEIHSPRVYIKRKRKTAPQIYSRAFGDVDNRIKPLHDSVFTPTGRDDVHIFRVVTEKHFAISEMTKLKIEWEETCLISATQKQPPHRKKKS